VADEHARDNDKPKAAAPYMELPARLARIDWSLVRRGGDLRAMDWATDKTLLNRYAASRYRWRLAAWVDLNGSFASSNFWVLWPRLSSPGPEYIAAVLNGPVAQAWCVDRENKRHVVKRSLDEIPLPNLTSEQVEEVSNRVADLQVCLNDREGAGSSAEYEAAQLAMIDSIVLDGYGLDAEQEAMVLRHVDNAAHPSAALGMSYSEAIAGARNRRREADRIAQVASRHDALVRASMQRTLTAKEQLEMAQLGKAIVDFHAPADAARLARLKAALNQGG
jgi:hypothetical protein